MLSANRLSQNTSKSPSEVRLVEVLDAYLAAAQEGTAPARDVLLAEHPELAEDLEACLASLEFIRQASLSAPPLVTDSKAVEASEGETGIGDLGDFRLIAEVGRGGMGVVYEAVQRSLNRRVALKVLPFAAAMDPTQLRRFQTEALAAAQLHHTHIVPVYSVGCERGVHYYAMQFIEGQTLAQAIAERRQSATPPPPTSPSPLEGEGGPKGRMRGEWDRPGTVAPPSTERDTPAETPAPRSPSPSPSFRTREYFRTAATLGMQAAEALDHAHKFGIVHRDIKPANLLLDVQGNLWITDFGLARLQDDVGLTITGDLLGTLRYMSPEQALGKRGYLDHRTDIYSLGATLYELVTLRPAIDGEDRQEVLRKIALEEPTTPRRLNTSTPRELETILLKAIAKEPESRYDTAQELADDLRRYMEHRPIKARRPTLAERAAKWARRHRPIVASGLILLAVMVISLAISSTLLARKQLEVSQQRDRANESAEIAKSQRGLAEQNARLARKAVDEMFTQVAEKWLADQPRLEPVQREFLEKALRYYEEFSRLKGPDPALRKSVADAWSRVGKIRLRLGMIRPAEEALRQALATDQELADESPASLECRYRVAWQWDSLGGLLLDAGKPNDAADAYRRSIAAAETLTKEAAETPKYRQVLADGHAGLGLSYYRVNRFQAAETEMGLASPVLENLVAANPHDQDVRDSLANNLNNLSAIFGATGRYKEAESALRRTVDLQQVLLDASPRSPSCQDKLAISIANLGTAYFMMQEFREAEKMYRRVLPIRRKLATDFPGVPDYGMRLGEDLSNCAEILRRSAKIQEAELLYRESTILLECLVRDHPELPGNRFALASSLRNLAFLLDRHGSKADADVSSRKAMEILEALIAEHPEISRYLVRFLEAAIVRTEVLVALDRNRDAEAVIWRALELSGRLAIQFPHQPEYTEGSVESSVALGSVLRAEGRDVEARDVLRRSLDQSELLTARFPERPDSRKVAAQVACELSKVHLLASEPKVRDFAKAVDLAKKAVTLEPESGDYRAVLAEARYRAGDWQAGREALVGATSSVRPNCRAWFLLAMTQWQLGDQAKARERYDEAIRLVNQHQSTNQLEEADELVDVVDFLLRSQRPSPDQQLRNLHAEAAALLGITDQLPTGKKEANATRPPKP